MMFPRDRRDDESGAALIMAVIVMMVLSTLSLGILARTLSVMTFMRQGQDYDAALAQADAGLSDALFKIDQKAPATWQATSTDAAGKRKFKYWAQKNSDTEYVVSAVGYSRKSAHGLQARVNRTAKFPYALFSQGPLHLDGAATVGGVQISLGLFAGSGQVRVGSNSTVVCNGVVPAGVVVDWYQTQSECPVPQINQLAIPRDMDIDLPPQPSGSPDVNWENCPNNGVFGQSTITIGTTTDAFGVTTNINVATSTVYPAVINGNSGPFVCRRPVTFLGTMVPNAAQQPVQIYILPRTNADGSKTHYGLDMSTAIVNPLQAARMFQVYKVGPEPILHNSIGDLTFRGVMFAPDTQMTINGGDLQWAGSVNVGQLTVNGTPNLKILYDLDLLTYLGPDWRVSRYREIASSDAVPAWGTP
jgi:hypothetical protein